MSDTLLAAILLPKFEAFKNHKSDTVNQEAAWYNEKLAVTGIILPEIAKGFVSSWAQYTVQLPENIDCSKLQDERKKKDIPTMILLEAHAQAGEFAETDSAYADCPVTEQLCKTVLSLPMHPYLTKELVEGVTEKIKRLL